MELKSSKFIVYPIVQVDETKWNVSVPFLTQIWDHLEAQEKIKDLFYDGHIKDAQAWIEYLVAPGVFPILVIDSEKRSVVHVAWIKDCFDGCAWVHHVSIGPYRRGVWETCRGYWLKFGVIHLLLGLTPVTNKKAVKFLKKICKFTMAGEIPYVCNLAYEEKRVPGIVSYYELKPQEVRFEEEAAPAEKTEGATWAAAEKMEGEAAAEA